MPELTAPLNDDELEQLDEVLINRFPDDSEVDVGDEGVLDISELDGFLTAIVSVPEMLLPSQWWPEIWGDYPPVFESDHALEQLFSRVFRHSNGIAETLMQQPADFEPMFSDLHVDGRTYTIVDEWCEGYMRGVTLAVAFGASLDSEAESLLQPILAFTEAADWPGHDLPDFTDTEKLQQSIASNVRSLHAYWLERREDPIPSRQATFRRDTPRVGRNDPCPCGSGKKFKKCCLH
jgi:uncharacterized protein